MTDNTNETQDKRQRTKTVMLGPDITKEIRAQLEEQKLSAIFNNNSNETVANQDDDVKIPSNFFYNDNNENSENTTGYNQDSQDDEYSIFGGENPIDDIQKDVFNETEVLTNSLKHADYQAQEVNRAKKETEEVASKIIKELILDTNNAPESTFKDTLIKEIENDDNIFKKFEYNQNEINQDEICKNPKIISFGESEVALESKEQKEDNEENKNEDENNLLEDFLGSSSNDIKEDNNNIFENIEAKEENENEYRETKLNLENSFNTNVNDNKEANEDINKEGIYWNEKTPLVGFLVSFDKDPNGDFYELREGKLVITTKRNANINSLVINDSSVSPMHALLKIAQDKITLLDQFSENGTTIKHADSDELLELSGESETVKDKDIITFGNVTFKVCLI